MMMIKLVVTPLQYMTHDGSNHYEYYDEETRKHMACGGGQDDGTSIQTDVVL